MGLVDLGLALLPARRHVVEGLAQLQQFPGAFHPSDARAEVAFADTMSNRDECINWSEKKSLGVESSDEDDHPEGESQHQKVTSQNLIGVGEGDAQRNGDRDKQAR